MAASLTHSELLTDLYSLLVAPAKGNLVFSVTIALGLDSKILSTHTETG